MFEFSVLLFKSSLEFGIVVVVIPVVIVWNDCHIRFLCQIEYFNIIPIPSSIRILVRILILIRPPTTRLRRRSRHNHDVFFGLIDDFDRSRAAS